MRPMPIPSSITFRPPAQEGCDYPVLLVDMATRRPTTVQWGKISLHSPKTAAKG